MAFGDVRTSLTTVNANTWFDLGANVSVGDTILAIAGHRTSAQAIVNPVQLGGVAIPTVHKFEDQVADVNARRALYLCALVVTQSHIDTWSGGAQLSVTWDTTTPAVCIAYVISGELDLASMQVATDSSGTAQVASLTPGPLTPSGTGVALAGLTLRHGAPGTVTFTDTFVSPLQISAGQTSANGVTGSSAVKVVSAATSTTISWPTAEESSAALLVFDQPGGGGGGTPVNITATPGDLVLDGAGGNYTISVAYNLYAGDIVLDGAPATVSFTSPVSISSTPGDLVLDSAPVIVAAASSVSIAAIPGDLLLDGTDVTVRTVTTSINFLSMPGDLVLDSGSPIVTVTSSPLSVDSGYLFIEVPVESHYVDIVLAIDTQQVNIADPTDLHKADILVTDENEVDING